MPETAQAVRDWVAPFRAAFPGVQMATVALIGDSAVLRTTDDATARSSSGLLKAPALPGTAAGAAPGHAALGHASPGHTGQGSHRPGRRLRRPAQRHRRRAVRSSATAGPDGFDDSFYGRRTA